MELMVFDTAGTLIYRGPPAGFVGSYDPSVALETAVDDALAGRIGVVPGILVMTADTAREQPRSEDIGIARRLLEKEAEQRDVWIATFAAMTNPAPQIAADLERWRAEVASFRGALARLGA